MNLHKNTNWIIPKMLGKRSRFVLRGAMVLLTAAILSQPAHAVLMVTNVVEDPGFVQLVPAMAPPMNGALMAGAKVEVGNSAGVVDIVTWVADGLNSGHAKGNAMGNWRLSLNGDSGGNPLLLQGEVGLNGIDYVVIDLMPDRQIAAFDDIEPNPGTPGTVGGTDPFAGVMGGSTVNGWDIDVTYRDAVAAGGNPPEHDIYRQLRIDFTKTFVAGDYLEYVADSDAVIPEPASLALLSGCSMLVVRRGRRRR